MPDLFCNRANVAYLRAYKVSIHRLSGGRSPVVPLIRQSGNTLWTGVKKI